MTPPPTAQARLLLAATSLAVGTAVFALSCLFAAPLLQSTGMGEEFAAMAADPFAFRGPFPHRIFGPLLGWLLGLGGARYWMLHHAVVVLLLAVVHGGAVARGASHARAALLTLMLSGAGAIKAYKFAVGYADPLTFLLLIAAWLAAARPARFWALLLAALLNHELSVLFVPWLLFVRHRAGGFGRADAIGAAAVLLLYFLFRAFVAAVRPTGTHDTGFFVRQASLSIDTAAMWLLLTVVVVISNGPLLALISWHAFDRRAGRARLGTALFVVGLYGTAIAALDLWRFAGLLFVPLATVGAVLVQRSIGPVVVALCGVATIATSDLQMQVFEHLGKSVLEHNQERHIVPAVIVAEWPLFAGYGAVLTALAMLGWWLARRDARAVPPTPRAPS